MEQGLRDLLAEAAHRGSHATADSTCWRLDA